MSGGYSELDAKSLMLGEHNARLDSLEAKTVEISEDVKKILAFMERSKGSWKTLVALASVAGAVVEAAHWLTQIIIHANKP